jgi:radical SAM protein with 4Fe4S-binding SPASM domain
MKNDEQYQKYRERYLTAHETKLHAPVDISLELSSLCNMSCSYCYHADKKNLPFTQQFLSPKLFKMIVSDAAELGVNSLKFNWRGEPTMSPFFWHMLKHAHGKASGMTFIDRILNSNFKFKNNDDMIFDALMHLTKVKVSYDSFDKGVFEKQRHRGDHDLTTANIDKFYNWPGRDNTLVIQVVRTSLNKDEDFESEMKRWPSAVLSIRDMVEGRVEKDLDDIKHKERDYSERQTCIQAHARLIFDWNGEATMCCPDIQQKLKLGNIRDKKVSELFNSAKAKRTRRQLISLKAFSKYPCKDCSSFETFKSYVPSEDS